MDDKKFEAVLPIIIAGLLGEIMTHCGSPERQGCRFYLKARSLWKD
ncbi:MAG: hypothetical protein LBS62_04125 [Clostridiales bacterium]|nr:hypothetical protein [Clostridiales bacterium]